MTVLIWREEALEDLEEIVSYIGAHNLPAAERLRDRIKAYAEQLVDRPYSHRPGRVEGTREAVVHPNYILLYRVSTDHIEVMSVLHSRMQYPR